MGVMVEEKKKVGPLKKVSLKGEMVMTKDLKIGMPVRVEGTPSNINGSLIEFGLVRNVSTDYYSKFNSNVGIAQFNKTSGEMEKALLVNKSFPNDSPFKHLTGTTGKKIVEAYHRFIRQCEVRGVVGGTNIGFTSGSDPEIFVTDGNGKVIPAFKFLRHKNKATTGNNESYSDSTAPAFWDGFQAEFLTKSASCLAYQVDSVQAGLKDVLKEARKFDPGAKLSIANVCELRLETLQDLPEEFVALGCMPSFNIYSDETPIQIDDPRMLPFRFAGAHIHLGCDKGKWGSYFPAMVRALDRVIGLISVGISGELESPIRRQFYGRAGEYRTPSHGLEYRTLSTTTMLSHPAVWHFVVDMARVVAGAGAHGVMDALWEGDQQEIREIINNLDVKGARRVIEKNKKVFEGLVDYKYNGYYDSSPNTSKFAYQLVMEGLPSVVKDPTDVEGNWKLGGGWISHSDAAGCNWSSACKMLAGKRKI